MNGCKRKLLIFIFIIPIFAIENVFLLHYETGMDKYRKGQYDLAIQEFEIILSNNWVSAEIYYNLGNAYYRHGNISDAIWAYENCLKLSPTHLDAKYNLKLTNLKVIDRMELPEPPIYLKLYFSIKEYFTASSWINNSLIIFFFFTREACVSCSESSSFGCSAARVGEGLRVFG